MKPEPRLVIHHATGECPVFVEAGWLENIGHLLSARAARWAVVTDETVRELYGKRFLSGVPSGQAPAWITLAPGEPSKSLDVVARVYQECLDAGLDRQSVLVALGGGVVGDLAGFVAATWMRGIAVVQVPTTLVAQVDSSLGGKTGVNLAAAKNIVGAFWQPESVYMDVDVLATLPEDEYTSGLAEVVKYAATLDEDLLRMLESQAEAVRRREAAVLRELVTRCCRLKASIIEQDERETTGVRAVLNYGHTFGHAIETVFGYGTWLHGHAVAAGMHAAACLARRLGMASANWVDRQQRVIATLGIPGRFPETRHDELFETMRHDKKAERGCPRFVLADRPGHAALSEPVPRELVLEAMREASEA
jgi:3-dehydroquinate synthase